MQPGEGQMGNVGLRSVKDDRGRSVPFRMVIGLRVSREIPKEARREIEDQVKADFRADRRWKIELAIGLTVFMGILVALLVIPGIGYQPAMFALPPLVVLVFIWSGRRYVRDRFHRVILAKEYCPSCGYRLVGTPPEGDGCTVCPECGAAWRLPCASASAGLRERAPGDAG